jgi:hypothetical protein
MYQQYQQQIYEPNDQFSFNDVKLLQPITINSATFIKFKMNTGSPLLIQSPKCFTKQGLTGKTTELVFSAQDDAVFLKWIESLENQCKKTIFNNRQQWFDKDWANNINELADINNYFRNILKPFKGAQYTMAVSLPPDFKIYDESQKEIDADIGEHTEILCILEVDAIKCNLSNFQIQIKVRQMMTIPPIFSRCLIKPIMAQPVQPVQPQQYDAPITLGEPVTTQPFSDDNIIEPQLPEMPEMLELRETDLIMEDTDDDAVELKDRKQIILELYKNAKEKARRARHLALIAYLEKNQIKNTYMLQDIESDDDDDDDDYDL